MDTFGLSPKVMGIVQQVLADFPELEKAVIYGSRAKGTHKPGSDIDLTLFGEDLTSDTLQQISARLDEAPIPHTVDLSLYAQLDHDKLREHINRVGRTFYTR